jgi:hypothetical protein
MGSRESKLSMQVAPFTQLPPHFFRTCAATTLVNTGISVMRKLPSFTLDSPRNRGLHSLGPTI